MPTDTPPGNNAPHAERTAELLQDFGFEAEKHAGARSRRCRPTACESITNLIVRRQYGDGPHDRAERARRRGAARRRLDARPLRRRDRRRQHLRPRRRGQQERLRELHLRACARSKSLAGAAARAASNCTSPTTRNSAASSGPGWLLQEGPDQARPDDRRRLQLRGGHRAQRLPADGSDGARQDGARRHPRHRRRRAAGRRADPERAVRAEHALPAGARRRSRASRTPT